MVVKGVSDLVEQVSSLSFVLSVFLYLLWQCDWVEELRFIVGARPVLR